MLKKPHHACLLQCAHNVSVGVIINNIRLSVRVFMWMLLIVPKSSDVEAPNLLLTVKLLNSTSSGSMVTNRGIRKSEGIFTVNTYSFSYMHIIYTFNLGS